MLRAIGEPLSLDWMRDAPVERSRATLCALPGVGRKTAACVLLFSFGLREFRSTRTSRASAPGSGCCAAALRSRSSTTRC